MKKLIILLILSILLQSCALFDRHKKDYTEAVELYEAGEYEEAAKIFAVLAEYDYMDSRERELQSLYIHQETIDERTYNAAIERMKNREFEESMAMFKKIEEYKDVNDYIATVTYLWAASLILDDPDRAVDMLISIKDYNEYIAEPAYEALYNKTLNYIASGLYHKAFPILENITDYSNSSELLDLCGKHIKYSNALTEFKSSGYSNLFSELGDFLDSENYAAYINAGTQPHGEAAEIYKSLGGFLDSPALYEKNIYLYCDEQFQNGARDFRVPEEYENKWRIKRLENLDASKIGSVEVTGTGIYVETDFTKYGIINLVNHINNNVPLFFLADSPEKVRYVMSFTGWSKYYGTYNDGTDAYETTVSMVINDKKTGQNIFLANYTAYPPVEGMLPKGDVHAIHDYLVPDENGISVYERDIRPALAKIFE